MTYDFCIIGGGILGLATGMALARLRPGSGIAILEKENELGRHQTGHNSGVIHAGIYYRPGSLKARLCRAGAQQTKEFCTEHRIPFEVTGKLLVATDESERIRMEALVERARLNGIAIERLDAVELRRREPSIVGISGLLVKETGIVDYRRICDAMASVLRGTGGVIETGVAVSSIHETSTETIVSNGQREWRARRLIACGGLQSDRLARLAGLHINHQIIPFRGEYYRLRETMSDIVRHLIYPVPDPDLPFLGVHLTRMVDGTVTVGPNAVLGFAREGYRKLSFKATDVMEYARFGGFWKTMWKNRRHGITEMKNSLFKTGYLNQCRKYCPSLDLADLLPYEAGIRAQAVMRDGTLVEDFLFVESKRMLHVCNAPSPAATSAIPIGEAIARRVIAAPPA